MKSKLVLFLLVGFLAVGFSQTLDTNEFAEDFVSPKLTLQLGFSYTALSLAVVNSASQPLFVVGTNFLGFTFRVTLNAPTSYEVKRSAEKILALNPHISQKELLETCKREVFSSRVLIFLEGGAMILPFPGDYEIEWVFVPFFGLGFYFPLGVQNTFLVLHLNFPLIGGVGVVYNF